MQREEQDKLTAVRRERVKKAAARKAEMEEKEKGVVQTEGQMLADAKRLAYAEPLTEKELQHDSAKYMDTKMTQAEAFVVRKTQLREKQEALRREKEWDDHQNRMMELDRIKDVKLQRQAEIQVRIRNKEAQTSLKKQIREIEHARMMAAEEKELEKAEQLARMRQNQQEEIERMEQIKRQQKINTQEVVKTNKNAKFMKLAEIEKDRFADKMILDYQRQKRAEEKRHEDELARQKREAEARIAKLRAQQERSADTAAEEDEARAQLAMEENERRARRTVADERFRIQEVRKEMQADARMAEEERHWKKQQERQEVEREVRIMRVQKAKNIAEERRAQVIKRNEAMANRVLVEQQVAQKESLRKRAKDSVAEERKTLQKDFAIEQFKLERVKEMKLRQLEQAGGDSQILSDVRKTKLGYN
jgi:hypothetical protein